MAIPYRFLHRLRVRNLLAREFLAEFWGTFILILIGDASFAWTIIIGNKLNDVFAVVFGWLVAVWLAISVAGGVTGGHVNPAVSFALATLGKLPWKKVPVYIAAQHLGAFLASAILYANYHELINHFDGGNRTTVGPTGTGLIWATYPNPHVTLGTVFVDQLVATGLLMYTAMAIIDRRNMDYPKWMHPIALGAMICVLAMNFGPNCLAPLNPARDFATRVFTAIAGWGADTFRPMNYHYWWIAGLLGPHLGAVVGGWLYYLTIELHWPDPEELGNDREMKELIDGKKTRTVI